MKRIKERSAACRAAAVVLILAMILMTALTGCGSTSETDDGADLGDSTEEDRHMKGIEIKFTTTDIDGNEVSMEDYQDASLILINLWEPWCDPCVKEMPGLQALYEKYKDKGFLVLGIFSDIDNEASAREVVEYLGITYPILHSNDEINAFASNYVPTSYFTDGKGVILCNGPIIGAMSDSSWEKQIEKYLE